MGSNRSIIEMQVSDGLLDRMRAACAIFPEVTTDPVEWVDKNKWNLVIQDGWADAWDKVKEEWSQITKDFFVQGDPDFGRVERVITDDMINAGVMAVHRAEMELNAANIPADSVPQTPEPVKPIAPYRDLRNEEQKELDKEADAKIRADWNAWAAANPEAAAESDRRTAV